MTESSAGSASPGAREVRARAVLESPDFKRLVRRKNSVSLLLTIITVVIYYGFITLLAYGKALMSIQIFGSITLGIPIGIGVIIASWVLTGLYVRWANREYDSLVARVRADFNSKA